MLLLVIHRILKDIRCRLISLVCRQEGEGGSPLILKIHPQCKVVRQSLRTCRYHSPPSSLRRIPYNHMATIQHTAMMCHTVMIRHTATIQHTVTIHNPVMIRHIFHFLPRIFHYLLLQLPLHHKACPYLPINPTCLCLYQCLHTSKTCPSLFQPTNRTCRGPRPVR